MLLDTNCLSVNVIINFKLNKFQYCGELMLDQGVRSPLFQPYPKQFESLVIGKLNLFT